MPDADQTAARGPASPLDEGELRRRELQSARASARALQAADEVRRDIGRHLHDRVQSIAIAARQQLYVGRRSVERDPAAAAGPLEEADRLLDQLNAELRDLARGLHPVGLERGLRPALDALAARAPLPLVVRELPEQPLGAPVEATVYAMVTEAINNAAKHAGATRVAVRVRSSRSTLTAVVDDDGVGGAHAEAGSGLLGLRDRLTLLGGTLAVDSPPGGGTTLRATIPIAPERLPHRKFFQVGVPEDPGVADRAVTAIRSGRKRAGLSLLREWEVEGGPPQLGQLVPVIDGHGRRRLTLEVTGMDHVRFGDVDAATFAACGVDGATLASQRAAARAFFAAAGAELATLLGQPGWALQEDEPMLVLRHRVVEDFG
jgi:uncharacterized protein YhfF/two-component sensor histidine kinase